jgi:hypothetical protein
MTVEGKARALYTLLKLTSVQIVHEISDEVLIANKDADGSTPSNSSWVTGSILNLVSFIISG